MLTKVLHSPLITWAATGLSLLGGLTVVAAVLLYRNQNSLLYMPNPPGFPKNPCENPATYKSPGEWSKRGIPLNKCSGRQDCEPVEYEEHLISTKDGSIIHVWLILQDKSKEAQTLIYFHGNAGNMGLSNMQGSSTGEPTEEGLNIDGDTVLQFAASHPKLNSASIVLFGRSLGGAVAVSLAHRHPDKVAAIIVENTFTSISSMVDKLLPFATHFKHLILRISWDSAAKISALKQPILFFSGDADELVPPSHMHDLYRLATASRLKKLVSVRYGKHNDTFMVGGASYYKKLTQFLRQVAENNFSEKLSSIEVIDPRETESSYQDVSLPTMQSDFSVN